MIKINPSDITCSDFRSVARALTIVENDLEGAHELLRNLPTRQHARVIGITGPPGAGKSTLVNELIGKLVQKGHTVAALVIDPTSPFNFGALLGDRIRMATHFTHPQVFIRSLATRGALGGLSAKAIEMTDVLQAAGFDYIFIETVGVGQSEVEIVGLADITLVVLVPEAGDEIQNIKSGLMEIADAFVINKCDREGADVFAHNLEKVLQQSERKVPIIKAIATKGGGINDVVVFITREKAGRNSKKELLLTEKAYKLIQQKRMYGVDKQSLLVEISKGLKEEGFNLYSFIDKY